MLPISVAAASRKMSYKSDSSPALTVPTRMSVARRYSWCVMRCFRMKSSSNRSRSSTTALTRSLFMDLVPTFVSLQLELADHIDVVWVDEVGCGPAVQIVFGQTL